MKIVLIILIIYGIFLVGSFPIAIYFCGYRNDEVFKFRDEINDLCYGYDVRHFMEKTPSAYDWFMHKYSYSQMLYSLKPLNLESWYTEEEIRRIKS